MTVQEINSLTLQETWYTLLTRLLNTEGINTPFYLLDTGNTFYERIRVSEELEKPSLNDLNNELLLYKSELIDQYEEIERVKALKADLTNRLKEIYDLAFVLNSLNIKTSNLAIYKKELIENLDEETVISLEIEAQRIKPIFDNREAIEQYVLFGDTQIRKGQRVLALINGINSSKVNLTEVGVKRLLQVYQPVILSLLTGSLLTAYSIMDNTKPDGTFTQNDKTLILAELNRLLS